MRILSILGAVYEMLPRDPERLLNRRHAWMRSRHRIHEAPAVCLAPRCTLGPGGGADQGLPCQDTHSWAGKHVPGSMEL